MNTLDINEFFNLIKGKIIDNSIKANLYSEEREIELYSQNNGIVRVSQKSVYNVNLYKLFYLTVVHNNFEIKENQLIGKIFQIPHNIEKKLLDQLFNLFDAPLISVKPHIKHNVAVIVIGKERYPFGKDDSYSEKLSKKLSPYNGNIIYKEISEEDSYKIVNALKRALSCCDMVFVLHNKSMDYQIVEKTIELLKVSEILPIFISPGNHIKFFYLGDKPVFILDEEILNLKISALNILLSRLVCGDKLNFEEMAKYSYGGICFFCPICVYPVCPFGKY
jgi:hypothetical protein